MPSPIRADVVVIGTGAGGGPTAALLAEAGLTVIVLEAGPYLTSDDFTGDEGEMLPQLMTARVAPSSGMEVYAGACVGGSTVVNDALCWRTPPEVLDGWASDHGLAWDRMAFDAALDRVWRDIHASPTGRDHLNRNAHQLELGAARLGWSAESMPRNVRGCANLGLCNLGCPANAKQSTLLAYVPRALAAGAQLIAWCRAERILFRGDTVRGVVARKLDPLTRAPLDAIEVHADAVCVAAGVLETGPLLVRSGVRDRAPRAGHDVQFHSSAYVTARFPQPIHGYYGPTMAYAVTEFANVNGHDGPGFMLENVAVSVANVAAGLPGFGAEHERWMRALPHLARTVVVLRDQTRGSVEPGDDGPTQIDYAPVPGDLARMRQGLTAAARAYLAAGAVEVVLPIHGSTPIRSEADLAAWSAHDLDPRMLSLLYAVHLFGGATLGNDAARSTCDPAGRVWGTPGLYVCDAAGLPSNTGVNPQVTVMANAVRIAEGIAANGSRPS